MWRFNEFEHGVVNQLYGPGEPEECKNGEAVCDGGWVQGFEG